MCTQELKDFDFKKSYVTNFELGLSNSAFDYLV